MYIDCVIGKVYDTGRKGRFARSPVEESWPESNAEIDLFLFRIGFITARVFDSCTTVRIWKSNNQRGIIILGMTTGSCEPELCLSNSAAVFWSCWILLSCSDLLIGLFFFFGAGLDTARGLSRSRICCLIVASTSGAYCMIKPWIFQRVGVLIRSMSSSRVPSSPT
jgi:hypothetical protein